MSLSNSISLIADKYYTIDEDTGQLIDITTLIKTSATILDKEILDRKADKVDVAATLNSKLNISTFDNFKDNILNITFNTKLNISDYNTTTNNIISNINNTFNTKLNISDYNTTTNNTISNINNTFNTKLNISDYNTTTNNIISNINNTFNTKLNISDYNTTTNNIISNINSTFLNKLDIADYNTTTNNIISNINNTFNTKLNISDYNTTTNNIISNINSTFNTKLNISDFNTTNTTNLNNINSRVLTVDYDLYKTETAANLATKVNILDYNANNVILGGQIATKLNISTFDLFKIENTTNLNTKLNITDYNATHQTIINLIDTAATNLSNFQTTAYTMLDERSGVFFPQPPLYFNLNIEGEAPRMELVLSENEVTTLTNFNNKTDITTFFNLYDTTITTDSKLTTINNLINQRVSETTLNSKLVNYLGYDTARSTTAVKSINLNNIDYLKFEGGPGIIAAIDRIGFFGTPLSVVAPNLVTYNMYCYENIYFKDVSKIYLDDLQTKYLTITNLSHLQTSTSNIQTQINDINATLSNKPNIIDVNTTFNTKLDISNAYTSTTVNSLLNNKLDVSASSVTTSSLLTLINNKPNIIDVNTTFNTKLDISNAYTSTTVNSLLSTKLDVVIYPETNTKNINVFNSSKLRYTSDYPHTQLQVLLMKFDPMNINNANFTSNSVFIQRSTLNHCWIKNNLFLSDSLYINSNGLNISPVEISYLDGCTSNIQTQINNINSSGNIIQTINNAATSLNMFNCSVSSNIYIKDTSNLYIGSGFLTSNEIGTLLGSRSNLQTQIDNNLSSLTTSINVRISSETLASTLSTYDTSLTVNSKLSNTIQYDPLASFGGEKVINFSGLASLVINTWHASDGTYKKDLYYDITNAYSTQYTRNTFFSSYFKSGRQCWIEGDIRLRTTSNMYLNSPLTTNFISATELYTLKNISSNIQDQINLKAPINNPAFTGICTYARCSARVFGAATVAATFGIIDITTANVNQTSTGVYVITMPTAHPSGANYAVIGSICPASGAPGFFTGIVNSSTQFTCYIYNSAGSPNSYHFNFMTIP